jgi:hypothetical protein
MKYDEDMIISTEQTIILAILVFENDRELIPVGNYKFQMPNSFLDLIVPIKVILRHVFANHFFAATSLSVLSVMLLFKLGFGVETELV